MREYTVNTEYRNKADAKAAVACYAAEQGLVDLLRFRGDPPPSSYTPFWEEVLGNGDNYVPKRKDRDREFDVDGQDRKRRKGNFRDKGSNSDSGDFSSNKRFRVKAESGSDGAFLFRKQPPTGPSAYFKNGWKKPRVTGYSNGFSPTNGYAVSRTVGQDRSEYRNSGTSPERSAVQPPTAPRAFSEKSLTYQKRTYDAQQVSSPKYSQHPQYFGSSQEGSGHSPSTTEYYGQVEPSSQSTAPAQAYSDRYVQVTTYSQAPLYPAGSYPPSDAYMAPYPAYPPSAVYPGSYPPPPPPPPPPHSYALYYGPHPSGYAHPPQYHPPYAAYSHTPQHAVHYTSQPPHAVVTPSYATPVPPSEPPPPLPSSYYSPGYLSPCSQPYSPVGGCSMSPKSPPSSPLGGDYPSYEHTHTDSPTNLQEDRSKGGRPPIGISLRRTFEPIY